MNISGDGIDHLGFQGFHVGIMESRINFLFAAARTVVADRRAAERRPRTRARYGKGKNGYGRVGVL